MKKKKLAETLSKRLHVYQDCSEDLAATLL